MATATLPAGKVHRIHPDNVDDELRHIRDLVFVRDLLAACGLDAAAIDAITPAIITRYLALLADDLRERRLQLFPGVSELLDAVEADGDLTLGLLTGNVREGAELKLRAAGVDNVGLLTEQIQEKNAPGSGGAPAVTPVGQ